MARADGRRGSGAISSTVSCCRKSRHRATPWPTATTVIDRRFYSPAAWARHANKRTDQYGGSVENRCRFVLEVVDALISVWGPRRTAIKICPADVHNASTTSFAEAQAVYGYLVPQLVARQLCYINVSRRGCNLGREGDHHILANPRPVGYELPDGWDPVREFGAL
ncbi:hypothetical protein KEM52_005056, partial [Ascosphaera acerosa]